MLALALFPGWHRALYVLGLYVVIEATTAYFVEPLVYGAKTGITALSVLLAAIFWGLIWGPVGLILSTPLTVCLVAFGKHIPQLEFLTILLGDDIQLSPEVQVYQRLLAGDPEEARDIAKSFLEQTSIAEVYDSLFLPVLILTEQDLHRGALEESRKALIFDGLKDLIEDLSAEADFAQQSTVKEKPVEPTALGAMHTRAVLVPARDEGDEIAAIMLAHLLNRSHYKIDTIPPLAQSQMLREISDRCPEIVCISALPPLSIGPARTLYRKVKGQTPKARIVAVRVRRNHARPAGTFGPVRVRQDCDLAGRVRVPNSRLL